MLNMRIEERCAETGTLGKELCGPDKHVLCGNAELVWEGGLLVWGGVREKGERATTSSVPRWTVPPQLLLIT